MDAIEAVVLPLLLLVLLARTMGGAAAERKSYGLNVSICGPASEVALTDSNVSSVATLSFEPDVPLAHCTLKITAPATHLVSLKFVETTSELHRARVFNESSDTPPCPLSIFLPQNRNKPVWSGDPCSVKDLQDIDILPSSFRVLWRSSASPAHTKGRKLVLTAVGKGDFCKTPGQHICSRIGWEPDSCVWDQLVCDGNENCPKGSSYSDESERQCKSHLRLQGSWDQFIVEVMRKMNPPTQLRKNKWLMERLQETTTTTEAARLIRWEEFRGKADEETTTKEPQMPAKPGAVESITEVLSHYGPWGYLMLGMLICGTVLMFCGLWECCFRRPKTQEDEPLPTIPTTVLIINQSEEEGSRPPSYEELDQPPSYSTLFPQVVKANSVSVVSEVGGSREGVDVETTEDHGAAVESSGASVEAESSERRRESDEQGGSDADSVSDNEAHSSDNSGNPRTQEDS